MASFTLFAVFAIVAIALLALAYRANQRRRAGQKPIQLVNFRQSQYSRRTSRAA